MRVFAPNRLRIFFLVVYIPLSVSIGLLHTDEVLSPGTGHLIVGNQGARTLTRAIDNGFCLACLFTAGHIVNYEPFVPVLTPDRAVSVTKVLSTSESSPQVHPARAPPVPPSIRPRHQNLTPTGVVPEASCS